MTLPPRWSRDMVTLGFSTAKGYRFTTHAGETDPATHATNIIVQPGPPMQIRVERHERTPKGWRQVPVTGETLREAATELAVLAESMTGDPK